MDESSDALMPVLFIGHGNPMNALEDNEFSRAWEMIGRSLPKPDVILCISAHWETDGTLVSAMERPETIHDFWGFPDALYQVRYPAPGSPELAERLCSSIKSKKIEASFDWGLDHGSWSFLKRMFPSANVPVVQLSLDRNAKPRDHFDLGVELGPLRSERILIVGSGNIVHNLGLVCWQKSAYEWAEAFDASIKRLIEQRDFDTLIEYQRLGENVKRAIPTNEHFLPLLYVLAASRTGDQVDFFSEIVTNGSLSMRCVRFS